MRRTALVLLSLITLVCPMTTEAKSQTQKTNPCSAHKSDSKQYADCLDSHKLKEAFAEVLGRTPTDVEFEEWKKTSVLGVVGQNKYRNLLLNWLYQPAQSAELGTMVGRAFNSVSGPVPRTHYSYWLKSAREKMLTHDQVREAARPDLAIAELVNVPNDAHSLLVRVANQSQWGTSKATKLYFAVVENCVASYPLQYKFREEKEYPVMPLLPGKNLLVKVTSKFALQGLHLAYYARVNANDESNYQNNDKCVNVSIPSKK